MAVVVTNDGDAPMQVQQLLFITGRPDVFFVAGDTCSGGVVDPGATCQAVVHFKPTAVGEKEASLFFITGNAAQPVISVGVNGEGVGGRPSGPSGTASVRGRQVAGGELACSPTGFSNDATLRFRWLRDGREVAGATGDALPLGNRDVGGRFACQVQASDASGSRTVTSPESAPVAARSLASQRGAFVDRWACRTISAPRQLIVGGRRVTVGHGRPVTPRAPLALRARRGLAVAIDGKTVGTGRHVNVSPSALSAMADGPHDLTVSSGRSTASARIVLAPCQLALRVAGGQDRRAAIAVSALTGLRSVRIALPRSLRLRIARGRALGSLKLGRAGLPDVSFGLAGRRTRFNRVAVSVTRRGLNVTGLPDDVGVIRLALRRGVLRGRGGTVRVRSALMGKVGTSSASARARWAR